MSHLNATALAQDLITAYAERRTIPTPSSQDPAFDLASAYAVESEIARVRRADGHATVGRKVGYANKALWRVLELDTLVWAHMYDDTVHYSRERDTTLSLSRMVAPKIEPEIVFGLKAPLDGSSADPSDVLAAVAWLAPGFEIIDCVFPEWKFRPVDFVAASGLHAALVVGERRRVAPETIPVLIDQLHRFTVKLMKNGQLIEEGGGKSVLRSPARCLGELAMAIARQPGAEPLAAGEIISSGTLAGSHPITASETWTAELSGVDSQDLTVRFQ